MAGTAADIALWVAAPTENESHIAWRTASLITEALGERGLSLNSQPAPLTDTSDTPSHLILMPLRSLADKVPALQVLELPFLFDGMTSVHHALDGDLGSRLRRSVESKDFKLLAIFDEGMHIMSGLRRYDRVANLTGMEFLLTRPDPIAEHQFKYWRAAPRHINVSDRASVLRECQIASRAVTWQQALDEQLHRVHLSVSPTHHRYEGWILVAANRWWRNLAEDKQKTLRDAMVAMLPEQRQLAAAREAKARDALLAKGLRRYPLTREQRTAYRAKVQPAWSQLLPNALSESEKRALLATSIKSTRAAVVARGVTALSNGDPALQAPPETPQHQAEQ